MHGGAAIGSAGRDTTAADASGGRDARRAAIGNAVDGTTATDASGGRDAISGRAIGRAGRWNHGNGCRAAGCHQGGQLSASGQVVPCHPMHGGRMPSGGRLSASGRWYHGNRCTAAGCHQAGGYRQAGRWNHCNRCQPMHGGRIPSGAQLSASVQVEPRRLPPRGIIA